MKKYLLLIITGFSLYSSNAQWVTNGPGGQDMVSFLVSGSNIFAGSFSNGLYVSNNNGSSWTGANSGLPEYTTVNTMVVSGSTIYLGTFGSGAYQSSNNGSSWTSVSGISGSATVFALVASGSMIVAGTDGGVVISTNGGTTWNTMNNGLEGYYSTHALAIKGNTIFAGTDNGLSYTTDTGANWNSANLEAVISTIAISDTNIFVGCINVEGAFISSSGTAWTAIDNGLPPLGVDVAAFLVTGSTVYMAGGGGIYFTNNNGTLWDSIATGQSDIGVSGANSLGLSGSTLFVGTQNGVYQNGVGSVQGIKEINDAQADFKLYPNPSSNNFIIETAGADWQQIQISDMAGQLLLNQPVSDTKTYIDASSLASGIYFVSLKSPSAIATQKLVVAR